MRRSLSYTVPPQWDGRPVKEFLRRGLGLSTRVLVKQKQADHGLLRNGAPCRSVDLLFAGDRLELRLPEETAAYQPVEGPLAILWEDQDYLVVDKPPQMPVHPSPGHDCDSLLNRVASYYQKTHQSPAFRPLYRLDRDTSGAIAIGKHRVAASAARVEKRYYAVCQGELSGPSAWRQGAKFSAGAGRRGSLPSPTGRPWRPRRTTPCWNFAWKQAAPIRSGCTWPLWGTPWRGMTCTAAPGRSFPAKPSTAAGF